MHIKKGEALLIHSHSNFDLRVQGVVDLFGLNTDVVILKNKSISIEDVRNFKDEFLKTSSETHPDFNKLGIIIFDDISISAQNSLLKILEDIDPKNCIILYANKNIKLLSTILSRVVLSEDGMDAGVKSKKIVEPDLEDKENIDKQEVIRWIEDKIAKSKVNKDKKPLIWINSPSPNMKYIVEYVNLFY